MWHANPPPPYMTSSVWEEEFHHNHNQTIRNHNATTAQYRRHVLADDEDDAEEVMGVHITYQELYHAMVFFAAIYLGGKVGVLLKMPALVGEIVVGIVLGPPLLDFVPNPEAFVLLGEIGYVAKNTFVVVACGCGEIVVVPRWFGWLISDPQTTTTQTCLVFFLFVCNVCFVFLLLLVWFSCFFVFVFFMFLCVCVFHVSLVGVLAWFGGTITQPTKTTTMTRQFDFVGGGSRN